MTLTKKEWRAIDLANKQEGWALFSTDEGNMEIMALDDPDTVEADLREETGNAKLTVRRWEGRYIDSKAIRFIKRKAQEGSKRHQLALFLHEQPIAKTEQIPVRLLGPFQ
jgi:hypothetical protein